MGPVRLFEIFTAMRLHWDSSYDYTKSHGRLKNITRITLDQSRDRELFYQMNKKHKNEKDWVLFLIPQFLESESVHISSLMSSEATEKSATWYRKIQQLPTVFSDDCDIITNYIKKQGMTYQQFFLGDPIIDFLLYDKINIESFIILNKFIFFLTKGSQDSIIYTQMYDKKVKSYESFISVDLTRYKAAFEKSIIKTNGGNHAKGA